MEKKNPSGGGGGFLHPCRPALGLPCSEYRFFFSGVERPGRCVDHPPPSRAEVKERVDIYLYSPLSIHGLF